MLSNGWVPGIVPFGADQTAFIIVDRISGGAEYRRVEIDKPDIQAIIGELISGRFNNPVCIVAFNTLEHWTDDVSAEVASEIQALCDAEGVAVPEHLSDFVRACAHKRH